MPDRPNPIQTYEVLEVENPNPDLRYPLPEDRFHVIKKVTLKGRDPVFTTYLTWLPLQKALDVAKAMNRTFRNVVGPDERE